VIICLERGADLHMAQLMPLPLTVSCLAVKRVRVCVCACDIQHFLTPAPNLYRMPEVMGRGQAFFPDDPGYTMPGYNDLWSFHRDYHQTPGPAAHDPTPPNVRTSPSSLHKKVGRTRFPSVGFRS